MPSFPPLAWWFSFCCLASARLVRFLWVVFRLPFFCGAVLSLPYIRGCSCNACFFLPSASSFEYAPWRPCRLSSGGFSLCPICSWHISLARPAAFSPGPRSLRFSSCSFSGIFLRGLLVSLCSLSGVFLFFCFCWEFFVFFFCSYLFGLSCPCMRRFPLHGFLACFFSLFFHYGRFFFFFCLPFVFTEVVPVLLFRCFRFGPVASPSSLVSYVFAVFSFSGVSSFSSLHPSSLFLLCFRFPTFQLGVRAFGGGASHSSSVILHRRSSECGF